MWKLLKAYIGIAIMYKYFNPNPCGKNVSDCTVRAICKATGKDWGEVYLRLCMQGYLDGDLPNANACWGPTCAVSDTGGILSRTHAPIATRWRGLRRITQTGLISLLYPGMWSAYRMA